MDAKISPNCKGAGPELGVSSRNGGRERKRSLTIPRTAIYRLKKGVSLLPNRKKERIGL